jgi:predicted nucleotidyltransferase
MTTLPGSFGERADPTPQDPVLAEIVRRLAAVYRPERIYLFGSTARGDSGPDSDYDLMVVVPDGAPAQLRRSAPGYAALRGLGVAKDILVSTAHSFDRQLHLKASFPSTIVREGLLVYAG